MTRAHSQSRSSLSLDDHAELDRICDQFAAAWGADESPCIEDYLAQVDDRLRMALLEELIAQEVDLRREAGEKMEVEEYLSRFPDDQEAVRRGFALAPERTDDVSTRSLAEDTADETPKPNTSPVMPDKIDRFEVQRVLGEGKFGVVYLAWDPTIKRTVAIKVPLPERIGAREDVERYVEEAQNAARLDHPGIVGVYDVRYEGDLLFLVQQFVDGESLESLLKREPLTAERAAQMTMAIAEALRHAHEQGVFHRDLKPANILVDKQGQPHVADFGLAVHEASQRKHRGEFAGSPAYMSPEQVRRESHRLDGRTDIWALGVILYEMLTHTRPFTGTDLFQDILERDPRPPRQINSAIPRKLSEITLRCLAKSATDRYESAANLREDLQHWLDVGEQPTEKGEEKEQKAPPPKVVPKGLRSFDAGDADFFLELLPGPHDREGLPKTIRFWKARIEETDPDETFAVGVMYGPSGCGKSSLVKAGLLPRLGDHVVPVFVEATPDDTEVRLLKGLKKRVPITDEALPDILRGIRERGLGAGQKLLLVLDQFEQWLHAHGGIPSTQLLDALRQCDGGNVQCLVLVREEYTMPCLRFLDGLDLAMREDENFGVVDLFDQRHSQKVLGLFGEAYGALPASQMSPEQEQFVEQSVQGLADDKGRVICVRLALYAEMVKDKTWVPSTLQNVGGAEGVGITFLEETLSAETAKPTYRRHQKEAERVLKALLPPSEADSIKGSMRRYEELWKASECERPNDFEAVVTMLDQELRLITPTDPEGREQDEDAERKTKYYQLTHDYLVPSLRRWLTQKQGETRRGRAELRLAERAALWNAKPENRHLPSLLEDVRIRAMTRRKDWTPPQRAMMRRSGRMHALRLISATAILFLVIIAGLYARSSVEARVRERLAKRLVDQILTADIGNLQTPLEELADVRDLADPQLHDAFENLDDESPQKLNASLALLRSEPEEQVAYLRRRLPALLPSQVRVVRQALSEVPQAASVADDLWSDLTSGSGEDAAILPLASTLAVLTPSDARWSEGGPPVAKALVGADTVYLGGWLELLKDVRKELLPKLSQICGDDSGDGDPTQRKQATAILRQYAFDQPKLLSELLLVGDEEQFKQLYPLATKPENASHVLSVLREELAKQTAHDWKESPEDPAWQPPPSDAMVAIEAANGVLDAERRFAFCQTMPWEDFLAVAERLKPCGFRPTRVRPFVDGEDLRIAAVWTRDDGTWDMDENLTSAQLPPPDTAAEKDGMVPIDLSAYRPTGASEDESPELRYLLVWGPPETADEQRRVSHGLTERQLEQTHTQLTQQKFAAQATLHVSVDDQGQRRYAGIWSNVGAEATPVPAYAGWQRVDQPQWDISLAPAGKLPDPLDRYRQQLAAIQQAPPEQADNPDLRLARAVANYRLGNAQASLDDLDFLVQQDTANSSVRQYRALVLARLGKTEEARDALEVFLAQDDNQTLGGYVKVLVWAWLGDAQAAQEGLDDLVATADDKSGVLYDAACVAAQAALALTEDDADKGQAFRERAFELLHKAQEAGYDDVEQLCNDPDLAPLHSDRRFEEVVNSMAPPARYATLLRADSNYETRLLSRLSPEEQLQQARSLIADGYRPRGITVVSWEGRGVEAASVWCRPLVPDQEKEQLALRQANAAVALAQLGQADEVWPLLKHSPDPRLRSYVIDRFASLGADPTAMLVRYKAEPEASLRRALLLTLGNLAAAELLTPTQREELAVDLLRLYREDPDGGIHGAAEWVLRQLGQESEIEAAKAALATGEAVGERQWYVTKTGGHTLVVIRPDGPILMGSPIWEAERHGGPTGRNEIRHHRAITRQYAITTHEVTIAQFQQFRTDHEFNRQYAREETAPANLVTWYDAAAFCNWLSREEGVSEEDWCYDPQQDFSDGMTLYPDYLNRTGYRLPTEAEWEYACRAGVATARYFGETTELLDRYAWYTENSQDRWMLPVGSLRPNDFGMFDMLGNAYEWCQNLAFVYPSDRPLVADSVQTREVRDTDRRVLRGGSFVNFAAPVRSAFRPFYRPGYRDFFNGFRVARTYNLSP